MRWQLAKVIMIIFYDKKSKQVIGTVAGRIHTRDVLENFYIGNPKEVTKFVVPFEIAESGNEMLPKKSLREDVMDFEKGKKKILRHKVRLNNDGNVVGFDVIKSKR